MIEYKMNGYNIEKIIYQNKGVMLDGVEGSLLDNYLIETKRGYIIIKERYINSNMSGYSLIFASRKDAEGVKNLFNIWQKIEDNYTELTGGVLWIDYKILQGVKIKKIF